MTRGGLWIVGAIVVLLLIAAAVWFGLSQIVETEVRGVPLP